MVEIEKGFTTVVLKIDVTRPEMRESGNFRNTYGESSISKLCHHFENMTTMFMQQKCRKHNLW